MPVEKWIFAVFFVLCVFSALAFSSGQDTSNDANTIISADWLNDEKSSVGSERGQADLTRQFLTALLLVGILGGAAYFVSKKLSPKITGVKGSNIEVLETVNTGGGRSLMVVRAAGHRKLLIGVTRDNLTFLADITEPIENGTVPNTGMEI